MKIYLVGGAVRDKLMGLAVKERDYVVVGATVEDMLQRGYRQVGKEFPVFLHPKTSEEYALARMERKIKPGYKGFIFETTPDVTLEDDLVRRDLTINAMAESEEGELIDPYHGKSDLKKKILRHVSPAFSEDPVRILRVGRFLARFAHLGFHIAPETIALMQKMVAYGEVDALVAERVWKELERALGEANPEKFFAALHDCHALAVLFPNLDMNGTGIKALIAAARITPDTTIRFSALLHDWPKTAVQHLCKRYRVPNAYKELALLTAQHYAKALEVEVLSPKAFMDLFTALDIFRREARFNDFVSACIAIAEAHQAPFNPQRLLEAARVAKRYDVQILLSQGLKNNELAAALRQQRQECIAEWLSRK